MHAFCQSCILHLSCVHTHGWGLGIDCETRKSGRKRGGEGLSGERESYSNVGDMKGEGVLRHGLEMEVGTEGQRS